MDMQPVNSSRINAIGYDLEKGALGVEFNDGSYYEYSDVPADVAAQLLTTPSIGKFFEQNIKNKYSFTRS